MHSDQDIVLSVLNPRSLFIEKGKFTWYIVPIRLVKNPYLYLQILPGQSDIQLTRSCTQSGDKLNTSEPQIFLSGSPVTSQDECLPYLLAQHTPPFLKSYARIHTFPGKVCPVNAIRRGKGYVRVSVDTPDLKREGPLNVKVGMTLLDDVIIAFRYNPYPKSHWRVYIPGGGVRPMGAAPARVDRPLAHKNDSLQLRAQTAAHRPQHQTWTCALLAGRAK